MALAPSFLVSCNHKTLGLYYIWFSFLFGLFGMLCSAIMRIELYTSGTRILCSENIGIYNLIITLHGVVMIFFSVQPSLFGGFGNYFVPIMCGAPEVAFPRINSISLLILPPAYLCVVLSIFTELSTAAGWTIYPPLSVVTAMASPFAFDMLVAGLIVSGLSSFMSSINFLTTILHMKVRGLLSGILPFSSWAILFTAIMLIGTLPILTGALIMLVSDAHYNSAFFDPVLNGDPVLYQHLFWFFGHPEVYILIIPGFAIISQIISESGAKPIFGSSSMVLAMGCISILGAVVWGHHMMVVGMEADTRAYFTAVTILISLPTGTKVFNWMCTYMGSRLPAESPSLLFAMGFVIAFTLGGTTGVILGNAAVDVALHDTYYVVAHFHFVLSLGAIISMIAGVLHFQWSFLGLSVVDGTSARLYFYVFMVSVFLLFVPMHMLGFSVMPRRIPDYPDAMNTWNYVCSFGSALSIVGTVVFHTDLIYVYRLANCIILYQ
uniref:Cytochrome c oxidase subunit 1 n=1 Tax=Hepatozoon canis TaxID=110120 RepID=A0A3Q8RVV9_9APIC|nr:cytochrome c oxidase subunit I [Hepatozoon canis]QBH61299.1 cytochrome c oxidase subunit I [Hepatozoon canis]